MKYTISIIIIAFIVSPAFIEIHQNYGQVRAYCDNCNFGENLIPEGKSGIAYSDLYDTEDEKIVAWCNAIYPLPCNYYD